MEAVIRILEWTDTLQRVRIFCCNFRCNIMFKDADMRDYPDIFHASAISMVLFHADMRKPRAANSSVKYYSKFKYWIIL
jgi:hypothetical protein